MKTQLEKHTIGCDKRKGLKFVTLVLDTFFSRSARIILALVLVVGAYLAFCKAKEGFYLENIISGFSYHPEWEIPLSVQEEIKIKEILNQPYYYLGKGGQAYAFESGDKKYVVKFLRTHVNKRKFINYILSYFPFTEDNGTNYLQQRTKKIYAYFNGYKLIYDENKGAGALKYLHFNPTFNKFGSMTLYDKIGIKHTIELDQVAFVVQQKGSTLGAGLRGSLDRGDLPAASKQLGLVFSFLCEHYRRGLYDRDYGVINNLGFIKDRPIFIDMGKMSYDDAMRREENYKKEIDIVTRRIKQWVKKEYPLHAGKLCQLIDENSLSG